MNQQKNNGMADWKFTAEDFQGFGGFDSGYDRERACHLANLKLKEWLEPAPKINLWQVVLEVQNVARSSKRPGHGESHTARLVAIEPIVKDSAESLLREYINARDKEDSWPTESFNAARVK